MLAGVKGLGATKVNSLLDTFNKPFMVGGIKRSDGTARPASDLTASKEMSTSDRIAKESGHDAAPENGDTDTAANDTVAGPGRERIESPDWPSDIEDGDADEEEESVTVGRGREKVPSRSPPPDGNGEVWRDPLDDNDEEEDEEPPAKRSRPEGSAR